MFFAKYWIIHKPSTNKTYIIKSRFAPSNEYLDFASIGTLTMGGPYKNRSEAENKLRDIKEELK